jgi:DNA replication ATP-dependent helicase Dna2
VYQNIIQCGNEEIANRRLKITRNQLKELTWTGLPIYIYNVLDPDNSVIFVDYSTYAKYNAPDIFNQTVELNDLEIKIINSVIKGFKILNFNLNDIAVITPYKAQENALINTLKDLDFFNIYTIDKSQGIEKEVIIISFAKTNSQTNILKDISRINVAFTRPRSKLIIVGCMSCLHNIEKLKNYIDVIKAEGWVLEIQDV